MTNREICLKAAQRLREVGWQQGDFGPTEGPHCMLGACQWAVGWYTGIAARSDDEDVELEVLAGEAGDAACHQVDGLLQGAAAWNDEPGRTVEEVIATLEACP